MPAPQPTGLIADRGIELITGATPNGYKASILLEELKDAYGLPYTWQAIDINTNTQKQPWFTALCPNGRIPVIVDHERRLGGGGSIPGDDKPVSVMEGSSILSYLTRHYDRENKFSFPIDSAEYDDAEQWIAWQHGGLGPMQGQANHFVRYSPERIPYGANRYAGEAERLYGVLEARLAQGNGRDYIAGAGRGRFSIADIAVLGWADIALWSGVDLDGPNFPNLRAWYERVRSRPAVARGLQVPWHNASSNDNLRRRRAALDKGAFNAASKAETGNELDEDPETVETKARAEADRFAFLKEAQSKYGYKFTSP